MPRIPGAPQVQQVGIARDPGSATPDIAGLLGSVTQTVIETANEVRAKRQDAEDIAFLSHIESNIDPAFTKTFDEVKEQANNGPESFIPLLDQRLQEIGQGLIDSGRQDGFRPSDRAISQAQLAIARKRGAFGVQAVTFENNQRVALITDSINNGIRADAMGAFNNPDTLEDAIKSGRAKLEAGRGILDPDEWREASDNLRTTFTENAVAGLINTDPEEAIRRLTELDENGVGFYDKGLTAESKNTLIDQAHRQLRINQAEASRQQLEIDQAQRSAFRRVLEDNLTVIRNSGNSASGVITPEVIRSELPASEAESWIEKIEFAHLEYGVRQETLVSTPEEDAARLAFIQGQIEAGVDGAAQLEQERNIMLKVMEQKNLALGINTENPGDPMGYLVSNHSEFRQVWSDAWESGEPARIQGAIAQGLKIQEDLEVPKIHRRAIPAARSLSIRQGFLGLTGDDLRTEITRTKRTFGIHFGEVFNQLAQDGMDTGILVASHLTDSPEMFNLAVAVHNKDMKEFNTLLRQDEIDSVTDLMEDRFRTFARVFQSGDLVGRNANEIMANYQQVLNKMALQARLTNNNETEIVERIYKAAIGDKFHLIDTGDWPTGRGVAVAVPTFVTDPDAPNGPKIATDPELIELSAAHAQLTENLEKFGPFQQRFVAGTKLRTDRQILNAARNFGYWTTNDKGDGMMLVIPTKLGGIVPLINSKGEIYERKFADIMKNPSVLTLEQEFRRDFELRRGVRVPQ